MDFWIHDTENSIKNEPRQDILQLILDIELYYSRVSMLNYIIVVLLSAGN